jgi:hypothetical protein
MKKLLVILLLPIGIFSQTFPDSCFTQQELNDISNSLDSLWNVDEINNEIIAKQKLIIKKQESIMYLDSVQIALQKQQVSLLQKNIDLYVEREKRLQPKWYDNKNIWFGLGIFTTLGSGILINEILK